MKKLLFSLTLIASLLVSGCGALTNADAKFEPGGSYARTETAAAMPELYATDSAFDLAYKGLDLTFKYEHDNRLLFWGISPKIKKTLDGMRIEASQVWFDYAVARQSYLALPIPANITPMEIALKKLNQINSSALAVIAKKGDI